MLQLRVSVSDFLVQCLLHACIDLKGEPRGTHECILVCPGLIDVLVMHVCRELQESIEEITLDPGQGLILLAEQPDRIMMLEFSDLLLDGHERILKVLVF